MTDTPVDAYVVDFARQLRIDAPVICDIGSRDAAQGLYLYDALGASMLHVFEANPEAARICRAVIASEPHRGKRVEFSEVAVSDSDEPVDFFPVDRDASEGKDIGFSSMLPINPRFTKNRAKIQQTQVRVNATTLDTYFRAREKPSVLWIDVEGAEMKVLRGAESVLPNVRLIHIEVSFRPMHVGKPLFWEIDGFLRAHGFRLDRLLGDSRLKGFLYRHRLLPNLPWRKDALYYR